MTNDTGARKRDLVMAFVLMAGAVHVIMESTKMRGFGEDVTSPGLFPFMVGLLICFMVGIVFFGALAALLREEENRGPGKLLFTTAELRAWFQEPGNIRVTAMIILFFLYIRAILLFDFLTVSIVFLFLAFLLLKNVATWKAILVALITPFTIQYLFAVLFRVRLP